MKKNIILGVTGSIAAYKAADIANTLTKEKRTVRMRPKKNAPGEMAAASARPASTPEAQEQYMINLAMTLVEKRLREGTASSAETTHFLKLATMKADLEKKKLEEENKLLRAKTETLESAKDSKEMYEHVLKAMAKYNGVGEDDEYDFV